MVVPAVRQDVLPIFAANEKPLNGPVRARLPRKAPVMLVNIKLAAQYYALTPKTLRKLAQRGDVQAVKIGSRWRFLLPALGGEA